MGETMTTFAEIIQDLRMSKNKKRQEVADSIGISRASLEYYEKGKRKPDIEVLAKFADYYNVSADYLLGRTNAKTNDKDVQFICDYTDLTADSVITLHNRNDYSQVINLALSRAVRVEFDYFCYNLYNYWDCYEKYIEADYIFTKAECSAPDENWRVMTNDRQKLSNKYIETENNKELFEFRVVKSFQRMIDKYCKGLEERKKEMAGADENGNS